MNHPIDRIAHTTAFVTPVVDHWLEQWVHPMKDNNNNNNNNTNNNNNNKRNKISLTSMAQ